MKKMRLNVLALMVIFSLTTSAFAGGNRQNNASSGLTTLEVFSMPANTSGLQEHSYWADILKEDLGVVLDIIPSGDQGAQKLASLMASKSLPDIVVFNDYSQVEDAVRAGLLVNFDDYRPQLPNVYQNIPKAQRYYRDNVSAGTGGLYSLATNVTDLTQRNGALNWGPYLRWDYYKELGMPQLTNLEDYLPLLKRMVDAHPTTADGQKIYGLSLWPDWDGGNMMMAMYIAWLYGQEYNGFMETDIPAGKTRSMLDDDSYYKRALQFIFSANQMGLLDPDSPTQHYDDQLVKMTAGRVLFSVPTWGTTPFKSTEREAAGIGFKLVPFRNEKVFSQGAPFPIGMPWAYSVGKGTKKLDAALKYIDYMFSYDGLWAMVNGRKGVKWDLDEKGEPYLTKTGWDISRGFSDFPNGGKDQDGIGVITAWGLATRSIHPVYKRQLDTLDWTRKDFAPPDTALDADWKKVMGAIDDVDYLTQHDMIAVPPFAPMGTPPDNIRQIDSRIGDVVKTVSWQMVYARTQAEFDRLWADMVQRAKGMGLDTSLQWYTQEYARANAFGAQYR